MTGAPSNTHEQADVVVIGGGPAGSAVSTMLARGGWRVVLLERERFPREHIGESLLPASMPILEELGALPAVQAEGFLPKWGATMIWGRDPAPWSWYFRETNKRYPHAYQVWRPRFDQILLDNAKTHGVDVRQGHLVLDVLFDGARATGVRFTNESGEGTIAARVVVDASGQPALLGRRLGLRRWDTSFQNLAVYGYFEGAERLPPPDETNIFIESYQHGWFWNIPLHSGLMSVGAVVDRHVGAEGIQREGALGFLTSHIAQAPGTGAMLAGARLASGPVVIKDWSYVSDEVVGDGYILAGDAACFIDPLFSSGVHLALSSGALAAAWTATALKRPEMAVEAGRVYKELYYRQYDHFRSMARLFYASNRTIDSYFWEARRLLGLDDSITPREAFIHAVAGQSPLGYERAVLDKGDAPEAFIQDVTTVRGQRAERQQQLAALTNENAPLEDHPLFAVTPRLAHGVRTERKPVLEGGEFVWGHALITPGYPEGTPCSPFVAALLPLVDGATPTRQIIAALQRRADPQRAEQIARVTLQTLSILWVDGAIECDLVHAASHR